MSCYTVTSSTLAALLLAILLGVAAARARAQEESGVSAGSSDLLAEALPVPKYGGSVWRRPWLTGGWCGKRERLARKGVFLDLDWTQVLQGVVDGGLRERWTSAQPSTWREWVLCPARSSPFERSPDSAKRSTGTPVSYCP